MCIPGTRGLVAFWFMAVGIPAQGQVTGLPQGGEFSWQADAVQSQDRTGDASSWLNVGLGVSHLGFSAITSASLQNDVHLFSLRGAMAAELFGDHVWDFGLLYGRSRWSETGMVSVAMGLALVGGERDSTSLLGPSPPSESLPLSPGIPVEVQAFGHLMRIGGIGAYGFLNVNPEKSFAGLSLSLQLGRLRHGRSD